MQSHDRARCRISALFVAGALLFAGPAQPRSLLTLEVGSIEGPGLQQPVRDLRVQCVLQVIEGITRCAEGRLSAQASPAGKLEAAFALEHHAATEWSARLTKLRSSIGSGDMEVRADGSALTLRGDLRKAGLAALAAALKSFGIGVPLTVGGTADLRFSAHSNSAAAWRGTYDIASPSLDISEPSGRFATEKLGLRGKGSFEWRQRTAIITTALNIDSGQAYIEPVFNDFSTQPLALQTKLRWQVGRQLELQQLSAQQRGVGALEANGVMLLGQARAGLSGRVRISGLQLASSFTTYAQPFLEGSPLQSLKPTGHVDAEIIVAQGQPQSLSAKLEQVSMESPAFDAGLEGLEGNFAWSALDSASVPSQLRWKQARFGKLIIGGETLNLLARQRDLQLLKPLRLTVLDGALRIEKLALKNIGAPQLAAEFDASIEPIELRELCRALGWPEFGGQLAGRLPGMKIENQQLSLDGALSVEAFDGSLRIENLQILEPFGRLPRLLADIQVRNLDLAALTGAFSFGRIDGRLNGDVKQLRLLAWQPVAFDAHLYTPADDRSRHRISQRAIDNISSIGGGPTGLLSRGALSLFKDFAYDRIGWSCVLRDGVCTMDGLEPAGDGYVLVKGRLLPRIDVVGYTRRVDWRTFVEQLKSVRNAGDVEVR